MVETAFAGVWLPRSWSVFLINGSVCWETCMQNVVQKHSLESRQHEALLPNEGVGGMEVCPGPWLCERCQTGFANQQ